MFFTSESVSPGHPDKIADQISDAILDQAISQDPKARVAVECMVKEGLIILAGEMTTSSWVDPQEVARSVIKDIGYVDPQMGFDYRACGVLSVISQQSNDIASGIKYQKSTHSIGAGDQGLMFGYACNQTEQMMPAPILYSHQLMMKYHGLRKDNPLLWPDAKCQVTVEYDSDRALRISDIVFSAQHAAEYKLSELRDYIKNQIILPSFSPSLIKDARMLINPAGQFVQGGPQVDCGLTGRKIIVDSYGGYARHGGGCFSGKDPSKVDRSAAYLARFIAKNIVAAKLANECEVQLSYAIGHAQPISIYVNTFGTGVRPEKELEKIIADKIDLTPSGIINRFDLNRPIYQKTATFGHFGREGFPWEKIEEGIFE
tara:strand:+ start:4823 stop:5941 length:1119 start_codon:yes stop_codon:yes gene_type:complete